MATLKKGKQFGTPGTSDYNPINQPTINQADRPQTIKTDSTSRTAQQAGGISFKKEKQAQGKFISNPLDSGGRSVVQSQDTAPNPNISSGSFIEQALANQAKMRAQNPQAPFNPVASIIPNPAPLGALQSQPQLPPPTNPLTNIANSILSPELSQDLGLSPKQERKPRGEQNILGISPDIIGSFLAPGLLATSSGLLGQGQKATVPSETIQEIAKSKGLKLEIFDGALQNYRPKTEAELIQQVKLLTPNKLTQYITKGTQLVSKLNPKSWGLGVQITAGLGILGTPSTLIWKYVSEGSKDISKSIENEFDSRVGTARTAKDYAFADELVNMKKDTLRANALIAEQYSGFGGVFPTIWGSRSKALSDLEFNPETGYLATLADKDLEFNERLRTGATPEQFFTRLEEDKTNGLKNIDLEIKSQIQNLQAAKVGTEGILYEELTKAESKSDANGADRKKILSDKYDKMKRDYIKLTVDQQAELIKNYNPIDENEF